MALKWDELRKRIYDKQDIALYDEAVKCYKSGAFRMAYIAVWICIAESLRHKLSIVAQKDNIADDIMRQIEEYESKHLPPDRLILDKSKEVGMLDDSAYLQIEHILAMRNIYAHPYNIGPIPKEVEIAFINAIDKVLSVPPFLRKPYIEKLLENLQTNRHFIDDVEEKVAKFAQEITTKITPALYPFTFKGLVYRLNEVLSDPDKEIFQHRFVWFSRIFINQVKPDFTDAKWRLKEKFDDFPQAVTKIFSEVNLWEIIPEDIQDGILGWLLYPEEEINGKKGVITTSRDSAKLALLLYQNGKLTKRQKDRFLKWIEKEEIENLGRWGIPLEYYVDRVLESLSSHNWYVQNPAASCLWNLGPSGMGNIPPDKLDQLGRNILQSADGTAAGSVSFIENTLSKQIIWPISFLKGLLYESFLNESLEFRCKHRYLYEVLMIIALLSPENTSNLFEGLLDDIEKSALKYGQEFDHGEKESIAQLDKAISELNEKGADIYRDFLIRVKGKLEKIATTNKK